MPDSVPILKLPSGFQIPSIGFGTYKLDKDDIEQVMDVALETGYRHFDCAYLYENEDFIGKKFALWFGERNIIREDIFVTTKLWNTFHRPDLVNVGFKKSLNSLQLEYIDLYLIHWPTAFQPSNLIYPLDADGKVAFGDTDIMETWQAMEKLIDEGVCRYIGVSNFNIVQLKRVLDNCRIKPAVLQIESHAHFPNQELIDFAQSHGVAVTAYSPLGSPYRPPELHSCRLIDEPLVAEISAKYGKSPGQVLLRHTIQRGIVAIPKTKTPVRVVENFQIFDFELSDFEMEQMNLLGNKDRLVKALPMKGHREFPF